MAASSDAVRLQVLVRKEARNPRGIARVEAALRALGFDVTGRGSVSLSARAPAAAFRAAFGEAGPPLRVPAPLADSVESITVAPPHTIITRRTT
jgi:hypothetical protein